MILLVVNPSILELVVTLWEMFKQEVQDDVASNRTREQNFAPPIGEGVPMLELRDAYPGDDSCRAN